MSGAERARALAAFMLRYQYDEASLASSGALAARLQARIADAASAFQRAEQADPGRAHELGVELQELQFELAALRGRDA